MALQEAAVDGVEDGSGGGVELAGGPNGGRSGQNLLVRGIEQSHDRDRYLTVTQRDNGG